jgi:hypothetical protein
MKLEIEINDGDDLSLFRVLRDLTARSSVTMRRMPESERWRHEFRRRLERVIEKA